MSSLTDYDDYALAVLVLSKMRKLTGDKCSLLRISNSYWKIIRYDPTGVEVEWE